MLGKTQRKRGIKNLQNKRIYFGNIAEIKELFREELEKKNPMLARIF